MTTIETGRYLARLREDAGFKQNELAKKIDMSPAVLSRIESGERPTTNEELTSILDAIGTERTRMFRETVGRVWQQLPRPYLGHPDEELLWNAEKTLHEVNELSKNDDIRQAFANRLAGYKNGIVKAAERVQTTEYAIAFVGDIGVGKTTAICRVADLLVHNDERVPPVPMLEVGAGGITVCDVHIAHGPQYGLHVEPMDENEIIREVREFVHQLKARQEMPEGDDGEDPDFNGITKELERAIRNMSGLTIKRDRLPDGKRIVKDPARELVENSTEPAAVVEILDKMDIKRRTKHELWHSPSSGNEPLAWLAETFREINNGRHLDFSIPKRIDIVAPQRILGEDDLSIRLVDTKGIDRTAERADIEAHFGQLYTLVVLCSTFNSAPSTSVQQLIERAVQGQLTSNMAVKATVLVLPKYDEALAVKDDEGYIVETRGDGYELKGEQVEMALSGISTDINSHPTFFDAVNDDPRHFRDALLRMVHDLRKKYAEDLKELITDAVELVANYETEQVREVQQQASQRLRIWLSNNQQISPSYPNLTEGFLEVLGTAHPSSVRASIRRQGEWYNLDYSHELGYRTRSMAANVLIPQIRDFKSVADNLLGDADLEDAHGLIRAADHIIKSGVEILLQKAQLWGSTIHSRGMEPDNQLWDKCRAEWGKGPGYRNRVSDHHEEWFNQYHAQYEEEVQILFAIEWQQILKRMRDILEED